MSVSAKKIIYDFYRKANAIISGEGNKIPLVDAIAYANDFLDIWFSNSVKEADRNQEVANELRAYKEAAIELELQDLDENRVLAKYPEDFHTRLNQVAEITKSDCCEGITKTVEIKIPTSDKLNPTKRNTLLNSNFFFERLIGDIQKDGLVIYHNGSCKVEKVLIDYYRKPKRLHCPSHEKCLNHYYDYDGKIITEDTEFESDSEFAASLISDGMVILAQADSNQPDKMKTQIEKLLQSRSITSVRD